MDKRKSAIVETPKGRVTHATISIRDLITHEANYNDHPPEQIAELKSSLRRFQQVDDVIVTALPDSKYKIVAHEGVYLAILELLAAGECTDLEQVNITVVPSSWSVLDIEGYMVASNETARKSVSDTDQLIALLQAQQNAGYDLASLGTDDEALRQMLEALGDEYAGDGEQEERDEAEDGLPDPETIEIRCQSGEIWQMGQHRLMVGDCTNAANLAKLLHGQKINLVVTSPPYTDQREYGLGSFNWDALMCGSFEQIIANTEDNAHILINLGVSHKNRQVDMYWSDWLAFCSKHGWPLFGWYVWDKGAGMPGDWSGRLAPAHEFLFHFNNKNNNAHKWVETQGNATPRDKGRFRDTDGTLKMETSPEKFGQLWKVPDSVIRINREAARGIHTANHPAVYPVALPEFVMQTWSNEGDIVYDPFCGSGTTIIAAENLNRRCYACEIDIKYASVILARWEQFTGQTATLLERAEVAHA